MNAAVSAVLHAITRTKPHSWDGCMPATNNERRAHWAQKYFGQGHHQRQGKPRIRVKPRVRVIA